MATTAILGALLVAACSGGDDDAGEPAATRAANKASTPAAPDYAAAGPDSVPRLEGAIDYQFVGSGDPGKSRFRNPLPRSIIATRGEFGAERDGGRVHGGLDLAPAPGSTATVVFAPCDGVILRRGTDDRIGRFVELDCRDGWVARIGSLGQVVGAAGDRVDGSQAIGALDATLRFVHVEILLRNDYIDPTALLGFVPPPPPTPTVTTTPPKATPTSSATPEPADPSATATTGATPATATPRPTQTPTSTSTPTATATPTRRPPTSTPTARPIIR